MAEKLVDTDIQSRKFLLGGAHSIAQWLAFMTGKESKPAGEYRDRTKEYIDTLNQMFALPKVVCGSAENTVTITQEMSDGEWYGEARLSEYYRKFLTLMAKKIESQERTAVRIVEEDITSVCELFYKPRKIRCKTSTGSIIITLTPIGIDEDCRVYYLVSPEVKPLKNILNMQFNMQYFLDGKVPINVNGESLRANQIRVVSGQDITLNIAKDKFTITIPQPSFPQGLEKMYNQSISAMNAPRYVNYSNMPQPSSQNNVGIQREVVGNKCVLAVTLDLGGFSDYLKQASEGKIFQNGKRLTLYQAKSGVNQLLSMIETQIYTLFQMSSFMDSKVTFTGDGLHIWVPIENRSDGMKELLVNIVSRIYTIIESNRTQSNITLPTRVGVAISATSNPGDAIARSEIAQSTGKGVLASGKLDRKNFVMMLGPYLSDTIDVPTMRITGCAGLLKSLLPEQEVGIFEPKLAPA